MRRIHVAAATVTAAMLTLAPQASAAFFADEPDAAVPIWTGDQTYTGVRVPVTFGSTGSTQPLSLVEATTSAADPVLSKDGTSCPGPTFADPTSVQGTAWFRLAAGTDGAIRFPETTFVTLDTLGSTFSGGQGAGGYVLAVYEGSVSQATLGYCEARNLGSGSQGGPHALLGFRAQPNTDYFLEVAGVNGSAPTDLQLSMRQFDIQAPTISLSSRNTAADFGRRSEFTVSVADAASGPDPTGVRWRVQIENRPPLLPIRTCEGAGDPTTPGTCIHIDGPNTYTLRVVWPRKVAGVSREDGANVTVSASIADRAGNNATQSLQFKLKDRTPPKLLRLRLQHPGTTLTGSASCSEIGNIRVRVTVRGATIVRSFKVRRARRLVRFSINGVGSPGSAEIRCVDRANNQSVGLGGQWG